MNNKMIRDLAKKTHVRLWQIAEALGIQESAFSKKLRQELPDEEQKQIIQIIYSLSEEETK